MDCENTTRIRMGSSLGDTRKMRWRGLWVWTGPRLGWQPFGFFFSPLFGFVGLQSVQWLSRLGRASRVSWLSLLLFVLCTAIGAARLDPAGCRAAVWGRLGGLETLGGSGLPCTSVDSPGAVMDTRIDAKSTNTC